MRLLNPVLGYKDAPEGLAALNLDCGGFEGQFHVDGTVRVKKGNYIVPGVVARDVDLTAHVHADQDALRITSIDAQLAPGQTITGEVLLDHWIAPTPRLVFESAPQEPATRGKLPRKKNRHGREPGGYATDARGPFALDASETSYTHRPRRWPRPRRVPQRVAGHGAGHRQPAAISTPGH